MKHIVIVTRKRLMGEALAQLIDSAPAAWEAECLHPDDLHDGILATRPDVIIWDVDPSRDLPLASEVLGRLRAPAIAVLPEVDLARTRECRHARFDSFLGIGEPFETLIREIDWVLGPIRPAAAPTSRGARADVLETLTDAELAVYKWMVKGLSNKEIAHNEEKSVSTVKNQVSSILQKLGASRRSEAIARSRPLRYRPTHKHGVTAG
jgi:DNA-binding NarL/FixJ family response regulator